MSHPHPGPLPKWARENGSKVLPMSSNYDPADTNKPAPRSDRILIWAVLGLVYAALAGVVLGFVYDAIARDTGNGQPQIWALLAPLAVLVILDIPALAINIRCLRRAAQSSIPLAVMLISALGLIINSWVIVRVLVVFFYSLFLTGVQSE